VVFLKKRELFFIIKKKGDGLLLKSVWSATGEIIEDEQYNKINQDERLVAKSKMIEWFCAPYDGEIRNVIESLINCYL